MEPHRPRKREAAGTILAFVRVIPLYVTGHVYSGLRVCKGPDE
jgi:hypothetical protein